MVGSRGGSRCDSQQEVTVLVMCPQVQEFFSGGSVLQSTVVQVLWERFTGKREASGLHRRAAVLLLGMAARYEHARMHTHFQGPTCSGRSTCRF